MSLLRKLASFSPLQSPNSDVEKRNFEDAVLEPGSVDCLKMVDIHWNNAKAIMALDEKTVGLPERFNILVYHLNEIVFVLVEEKEGDPGPCLQYVLDQGVFQSVYLWSVSNKNYLKDMQREQLRLFRNLIEKAKTHLLIYEQVWKPLLYLLHSCTNRISPDTEEHFVAVLKGLCVSANRDIALLDLFFLDNHHHGQIAKLSVFSLLIPFVHREANVGNWARDAMLLSMALSSVDARLGTYIAEETDFCPVLATGLSALYSLLPTSLDIPSEDWYSLERGLWATFPELVAFLTSLEFCNNVIQIAHPRVRRKLLNLVYHGFLVSVMAPALSQSSTEALMAATAYLDLFLRSITDANLMKVFVKFIMIEKSDGTPILDSLVSRIGHESQLAVISLGLFYTLLDLNCEDIMYTLVLRYLIPCTHILSSQKRTIKEVDLYSKSALKFLSLIPTSCELNKSRSESPTPSSSCENLNGNSHTPLKIDIKASSELVFYRTSLLFDLYAYVCADYMEYLAEARVSLKDCQMRCTCWSAPYDGQTPAPQDVTSVDRQRSVSNSVTVANGSVPGQQFLVTDTSLLPSKRSKSTCDSEQNECSQSLGPFLVTLFQKVERMPQNSFYVNLILTAVVTRLALYPQPLLRSFLLNYNMVLKPGVRSLFQILSSVKIKLENLAEQIDGLDTLLRRAKKNLVLREEKSRASIQSVVTDVKPKFSRHSEPRSPTMAQKLLKQRTDTFLLGTVRPLQDGPAPRNFGQNSPKLRKHSLGAQASPKIRRPDAERRASVSTSTSSLSLSGSCESLGSLSPRSGSNSDLTSDGLPKPGTVQKLHISLQFDGSSPKNTFPRNTFKRKNPKIVKNAVYCMVVLEHWLKELAAISQEQALLLVGSEDSHG